MRTPIILRFISLLPLLLQTACIGTTPPSQFYMLEPIAADSANVSNSGQARLILALAPVKIPHYLDRSQMVNAAGKNTYQLDELHRWAERLDENMTRVMLQDLTQMIPADVVLTTNKQAQQAAFRLMVNVLEFHVDPQGQAGLMAQWQVSRGDRVILSQQSSHHLAVASDDVSLKVQALNHCFNQLNQEIASAISGLKRDPG